MGGSESREGGGACVCACVGGCAHAPDLAGVRLRRLALQLLVRLALGAGASDNAGPNAREEQCHGALRLQAVLRGTRFCVSCSDRRTGGHSACVCISDTDNNGKLLVGELGLGRLDDGRQRRAEGSEGLDERGGGRGAGPVGTRQRDLRAS